MQHMQYMNSQKCVVSPSIIPQSLNKEIKSQAHPVTLHNQTANEHTHHTTNANTKIKTHVIQRKQIQITPAKSTNL
jgi:hypothetical protein